MVDLKVDNLQFPATQVPSADPNNLDDYREGTFVTTLTLGTSGTATLFSTIQTLQYTKNGRSVTVHGRIRIQSVSSPVGTVMIALPFASGSGTQSSAYSSAAVVVDAAAAGLTGAPCALLQAASSNLLIYRFSAGVIADIGTFIQANTDFYISVTYDV